MMKHEMKIKQIDDEFVFYGNTFMNKEAIKNIGVRWNGDPYKRYWSIKANKNNLKLIQESFPELTVLNLDESIFDECSFKILKLDDEPMYKIGLKFDYDVKLIKLIKESPFERVWDGEKKMWKMPDVYIDELQEYLTKNGVKFTVSERWSSTYFPVTGIVKNGMVYLHTISPLSVDIMKSIKQECSYQAVEMWILKLQNSGWDGKKHLFNERKMCFPIGLLSKVENYTGKIQLKWENEIGKQYKMPELKLNGELHDYQKRCIDIAIKKERGNIVIPTGGGKTLIAIEIIRRLGRRAIITCHTKELFYQWHDNIKKYLGYESGLIGDGKCIVKNITVAMYQSLSKKLENLRHFDVLVCDEIFIASESSLLSIARNSKARWRYGLGATSRLREVGDLCVVAISGETIFNLGVDYLIDNGYLSLCSIKFVDVQKKKFDGEDYASWYGKYIIENEDRNDMIVEETKKMIEEKRHVLVIVTRIEHGNILSEKLQVPFLNGSNEQHERKQLLDDFRDGKINCLISTLLDVGIDIPRITGIVLAGPSKSQIKTIQRVGRGLRKFEGKSGVKIIDFYDDVRYFKQFSLLRKKIYEEMKYHVE